MSGEAQRLASRPGLGDVVGASDYDAISALLGPGEEATVVTTTAKDDPPSWAVWDRDRPAEQALRDRFR
jgi:hypothetical protein